MSAFLKKTTYISLILIAFFSIVNVVNAQESVSNSISSINLNISPSNPRPGDSAILTLSSDLLDLDSSKIVWYIDGVARKETTSKSITIKVKNDGEKTTIRVVVETTDGVIKETSGEISPAGVDLIIEPISYTLPFYKGKPFFIAEGTVKITALADVVIDGVKTADKDLNYKWTKDGEVLSDNSGKGKNSVVINSSIPARDIDVGVQILDNFGNVLAENTKTIIKNTPEILFYENSPLYGILYNSAITGSYYMGTREELTIVAKPFSFSFSNDTQEGSNYTWSVNGNSVVQSGKTNEITLRQTATNLKSMAIISLDIKNINKIMQYMSDGFNVEFGQ